MWPPAGMLVYHIYWEYLQLSGPVNDWQAHLQWQGMAPSYYGTYPSVPQPA